MSLFPSNYAEPAFSWEPANLQSHQFGPSRGRSGTSSASYTHARAPKGGVTIQGRFYPGGKWIPKEVLEDAGVDHPGMEKGAMDDAGGGDEQQPGEPLEDTHDPLRGEEGGGMAGPDEGGFMQMPMAPPPMMKQRPPSGIREGEEPPQLVRAGIEWLSQIPPQVDPDNAQTWIALHQQGVQGEAFVGALLGQLASLQRKKFSQWVSKGVSQMLGDQAVLMFQVPPAALLAQAAVHPEVMQRIVSYSRDPSGLSLQDPKVLHRAVVTAAESPEFGQLVGRVMVEPQPMMFDESANLQFASAMVGPAGYGKRMEVQKPLGARSTGLPQAARDTPDWMKDPLRSGEDYHLFPSAHGYSRPGRFGGSFAKSGRGIAGEHDTENFLRELGVPVPQTRLTMVPQKYGAAEPMKESEWMDATNFDRHNQEHRELLVPHLVAHALIGNEDLSSTNVKVGPQGIVFTDVGDEGLSGRHPTELLSAMQPYFFSDPGEYLTPEEFQAQLQEIGQRLPAALDHISDPRRRQELEKRFHALASHQGKMSHQYHYWPRGEPGSQVVPSTPVRPSRPPLDSQPRPFAEA